MSTKPEVMAWLVLVWRLPTGESSANRVSVWRALRSLGAVGLTPGAAVLPFSEDSVEQFDWLAQEVEDQGGDAWVLPVAHMSGLEERRIRDRMRADRQVEYEDLRKEAADFLRSQRQTGLTVSQSRSVRQRELVALQRRFEKIRARDFFNAPGRRQVAASIDRCLASNLSLPARAHPKG
jgi:ChrB-like protein